MLKYLVLIVLMIGFVACGSNSNSKRDNSKDTVTIKKPLSPHDTTMLMIDDTHILIDYSSPSVRGRDIFGDLIPFGKVWRAGANNATSIETSEDIRIDDQILPKGKYSIFIIPNEKEWTLIFNTRWDVHGTDKYDNSEDVFRITLSPLTLNNNQEHLKYKLTKTGRHEGSVELAWEKTQVQFHFSTMVKSDK